MRSRFGQNMISAVRAAASVSLVILAGFVVSSPMGCGKVESTPPATPSSPSAPTNSLDAIPVTDIVWNGDANPSTWTPVVKIDGIEIRDPMSYAPTICWKWDQPNWPYKDGKSLGNNWIIVKIGGVWHATPWEHLPEGNRVCRTTEANRGQPPFIQGYPPISSWYPTLGEDVGFMNSTIARGSQGGYNNPHERSYIMLTKWQ